MSVVVQAKAPALARSGPRHRVRPATPRARRRHPRGGDAGVCPVRPGGARVDRIAARAKTNKRMLYYYFGGKDDLFLAVLERAYEHIRSEEQRLRMSDLPPVGGVTRLIVFTWNYFLAHPEFMTLLNSENLHRAAHLKRSRKIRAMHSPLVATLSQCWSAGPARASSGLASTPSSSTCPSPRWATSTSRKTINAVDHLRPRPHGAQGQGGAARAHQGAGAGLPAPGPQAGLTQRVFLAGIIINHLVT